MRISSFQVFRSGIEAIQRNQQEINHTQLQLGSGRRILTPSDDPSGAVQTLKFRTEISRVEQYQRNGVLAEQRLRYSESILNSVGDGWQRVRQLALQGSNASQTQETRSYMAREIRETLDELLQLANTRDANGEYIFAGNQSETKPFVKQAGPPVQYGFVGSSDQRSVQISAVRQVQLGESGARLFMNIPDGNGTFAVKDAPNNQGSGVISQSDVISASAWEGGTGNYQLRFVAPAELNGASGFSPEDVTVSPSNIERGFTIALNDDADEYRILAPDGTELVQLSPVPADGDGVTTITYAGVDVNIAVPMVANAEIRIGPDRNALQYQLIDSSDPLNWVEIGSPQPFSSGAAIEFNGARIAIQGQPEPGDVFTIRSSENKSLFSTYLELADALETGVSNPAETARLNNAINRALGDLDQAQAVLLDARAELGSRMQAVENQYRIGEDQLLQMRSTLSEIEDLDYAEAISRFSLQQTTLQAAQQTYVQVQRLSLFNYL